jgi:putative heme transporter
MEPRVVACRMVAFLVLLYTVYGLALILVGVGLYTGVLPGGGSFAITIIPAILGTVLLGLGYGTAVIPADLDRRLEGWATTHGRGSKLIARLSTAPAAMASGVRTAVQIVGDREVGVLGGVLWWGFDIAALWASFHAFGADPPPTAVIVLAYFVGMLGNTLPLPGGIGGVDGGMIGAFAAFNVDFGLATVAVLTYRAFSFWLPTIPGAIAYLQLRRTVARWTDERRAQAAPAAGAETPETASA